MIKLTIPGEPCAQGRPRFSTAGGFVKAYDPGKSRNYKAFVKLIAMEEMKKQGWKYTERPLLIRVDAYLTLAKSRSKKFKADALAGREFPTKKPDADNLLKTVMDALSGVLYKDDKQIIDCGVRKYYAEEPKLVVMLDTM